MSRIRQTLSRIPAALLVLGAAVAGPALAANSPASGAITRQLLRARMPLIENTGARAHPAVRFEARTLGGSVFVTTRGEVVYNLPVRRAGRVTGAWALREVLSDAAPLSPAGLERSKARVSRFLGPQADHWEPNSRTWDSITLGRPYPGIHIELRATGGNVEKLFHILPGADPERIMIEVDGADDLTIDSAGQLLLGTPLGSVAFTAPRAFQIIDGTRREVPVSYRVQNRRYGFHIGAYDPSRELLIDPLLASTLLGGEDPDVTGNYDDDIIYAIAARNGEIYVAGVTQAPNFPTQMGYDETYNGGFGDAFVTRLTEDLSTILSSTYIGSSSIDNVQSLALTAEGRVLIAGRAGSGFPYTAGAFNWRAPNDPAGSSYVAMLSADLGELIASAHVSPSQNVLTLEPGNGGVYYGGSTNSPDEPVTPDAWDPTCGTDGRCNPDGFGIRKFYAMAGQLSADLSTVLHMTYLDGRATQDIAVGPDGSVYIADGADSATTGQLQHFDAGLSTLLGRAPTGSTSRTYFHGVAVGDGFIIGVGQTHDADFLPRNGSEFDTTCGSDGLCDPVGPFDVPQPDGFIARFSPDLTVVQAAAFLGGEDDDAARAVTLDADGSIFVVGETISSGFPIAGSGADTTCGTDGQCNPSGTARTPDGYLARVSADLTTLMYSTYVGGSGKEAPRAVALDARRAAYIGGNTDSHDFPTTPGAFDSSYNGGTSDAFVSSFDTGGMVAPAGRIPGAFEVSGVPLEIDRQGDEIVLTWSPTCGDGLDYAVYEGLLGDLASAAPRQCSTGGATNATLVPADGQRFYLIAAQSTDSEGSWGRNSRGAERTPSPAACLPQAIGGCP